MKKSIILLLLSFFSFNYSAINAENKPNTLGDPDTSYLNPKPPKDRPHAPAKIFLECHYSVGHLTFVIPDHINFINISISNDDVIVWNGMVSKSNPETYIPELLGEYTITCKTDGNQIFEGSILFN